MAKRTTDWRRFIVSALGVAGIGAEILLYLNLNNGLSLDLIAVMAVVIALVLLLAGISLAILRRPVAEWAFACFIIILVLELARPV